MEVERRFEIRNPKAEIRRKSEIRNPHPVSHSVRSLHDIEAPAASALAFQGSIAQATLAVRGKGRTSKQILSVSEATRSALQAWLDARDQTTGPLFTNFDRAKKGRRLTGVGLYRVVRDLGQCAGLKVRPHGLRHTAITEACKAAQANGIGLEEVLDFSRHSRKSIAVLMVYRDRERNVQGQLASLVAAATSPSI
ncbi:MAG: tyrosine-type recombinase/integrase [Verrucomicrobiota bacterium]|jgi:integrase/recombinase XerC